MKVLLSVCPRCGGVGHAWERTCPSDGTSTVRQRFVSLDELSVEDAVKLQAGECIEA